MVLPAMEERMFGGDKPLIELRPVHMWNLPIEEHIGGLEWDKILNFVSERAGNRCEFCEAGPNHKGIFGKRAFEFKVHLRFSHDDNTRIATLKRLVHVCSGCNYATHLKQAQLKSANMPSDRSLFVAAMKRLMFFHKLTENEVKTWLDRELALWASRKNVAYPDQIDVAVVEAGLDRLWRP